MKRTFNHTAASYRTDTGGNVAMIFAICLFFLIGLLAVAVDLANGFSAKQRLQDTTDAVALLAAKDKTLDTREKLEAAAQALYDATYPGESGVRIEIEDMQRIGDQVIVVSKNNIDTNFAGVFNISDLDVSVTSSAVYSKKSLDVALVLDTTGSMRRPVTGSGGPSKLSGLQTAATGLIDTLEGADNENLRLSIVPFAQYVNVGVSNSRQGWVDLNRGNEASWTGCVGSRLNGRDMSPRAAGGRIPALLTNDCGSEVLPLTNNMNDARTAINNFEARGWTYIPSGIVWGWRTLAGELPVRVAPVRRVTEHKKVMVIMTDGQNTRSKSGFSHDGQNLGDANYKTRELCNLIKRDEIEVYTIAYALDDNATMQMLRNCATDSSKFFDARTSADLNRAFNAIGAELEVLRVTS